MSLESTRQAALPEPGTVTVFSTPWCGYCQRLTRQMDQAGVSYTTINIEEHPESAKLVESLNNGNQTVPTLLFSDGASLTNPSLREVNEHL